MGGNRFERPRLMFLISFHIVICCISLVYVTELRGGFHIFYDPLRLPSAVAVVIAFSVVGYLFAWARFSFGYVVGFYLYTLVLGYLWLNHFSDLDYDHRLSGLSAAASAVALLMPALFMSSPLPRIRDMSVTAFDRLLMLILVTSAIAIAIGATYNFRFVSLEHIYDFRDKLESPTMLNYLIGMISSTLLPFAFAGLAARKAYWRAGAVLLLLICLYPITLSKTALFAPFWLAAMLILSLVFEARIAAITSLFLPILAGVLLVILFKDHSVTFFNLVNFRMVAVPSNALDIYNDFFSRQDLTYFCQISVLKWIVPCSYGDPLSIVMAKTYDLGNFNASLFATEGIASVGPMFAPVSAFACGLVIALGNRLSAGLPPSFILISGAILPLVFLNVPLTTAFLTHGVGILFLLWYFTPRSIFEKPATDNANSQHLMGQRSGCRTF